MAEKINCWEIFSCAEKDCPVFIQQEPRCWLVSGTFCRKELQGRFIEKMEMCLECAVLHQNIDPDHLRETLRLVSLQFREATQALRDRELKESNSELALGLCQHYDTLNRIAGGDLSATANEDSDNELIAKLGQLINKETRTLMGVISDYRKAEANLQEKEERYRLLFEQSPVGVFHFDHHLRITDCNDRFVTILRSSREQLLNLDLNTLRDQRVLPSLKEALTGGPGFYEGPYSATTSPAVILISMRTAPLLSREGRIQGEHGHCGGNFRSEKSGGGIGG